MSEFKHFVVAKTPTVGNPTPLIRAGVSTAPEAQTMADDETLVIVPSLAGRTAEWGFWQGMPRRSINPETLMMEEEDTTNWTPTYLMYLIDGEYVVAPTEPPCIAWMEVRSNVSASLTIT